MHIILNKIWYFGAITSDRLPIRVVKNMYSLTFLQCGCKIKSAEQESLLLFNIAMMQLKHSTMERWLNKPPLAPVSLSTSTLNISRFTQHKVDPICRIQLVGNLILV
jgi:hypothetical protein